MPDFAKLDPQAFLQWVQTATVPDLVEGLCSLTDADRRRYAKEVASAHRKSGPVQGTYPPRNNLALVAVCAWSDVKRMRVAAWWWQPLAWPDELIAILAARKPDWLGQMVEQEVSLEWPHWSFIRRLVRDLGALPPTDERYTQALIRTRAGRGRDQQSLIQRLKDDPGLLEGELWRMFEVDSERPLFIEDQRLETESWELALAQLAAEGMVDSARLTRASLETLRRGLQLKDSGFHLRLIERLDPPAALRAALQEVYLDLLGHRADAVVRFAVGECARLHKEKALSGAVLLERIAPALQREGKAPAEAAIKLIAKIARQEPALRERAAEVALEGLRHPLPALHEAVLDLLESLAVTPPSLRDHLETMASSQRSRAEALLGGGAANDGPAAPDLDDLLQRAQAIDEPTRAMAGIDALLASVQTGSAPPLYVPAADRIPRLDPAAAVQPIRDFNELLDVALVAIDGRPAPIDVERALDGFSRFAAQPPFDFRLLTGPLLQRAKAPADGIGDFSSVSAEITALVLHWLQGNAPGQGRRDATPEEFLERRVLEIVQRIRRKVAAPLLALPTHGAWLDPLELVSRMTSYQSSNLEIGESDLLQALLRLAPEHRDEALAAAESLKGEEGEVVRYALGGGTAPRATTSSFADRFLHSKAAEPRWYLWSAASRARAPFAVDFALAGTGADLFPYGARPAVYTWTPKTIQPAYGEPNHYVDVHGPRIESADRSRYPLALFWIGARRWIFGSTADIRHRQTIWPVDLTPSFAIGIHSIVDRMFRPASVLTPTSAYLEPLLDSDTVVPELGLVAVALALVAQDADARTMASDTAIALFADGRSDGRDLGMVYARLLRMAEGILRLGRVAEALEPISRISPAHRHASLRCVEELLLAIDPPAPKDLHHLLVLYRELLAATQRSAAPALAPLLSSITGTGKAAKLAREITSMPDGGAGYADAAAALLSRRLEIVEGWKSRG